LAFILTPTANNEPDLVSYERSLMSCKSRRIISYRSNFLHTGCADPVYHDTSNVDPASSSVTGPRPASNNSRSTWTQQER